MIEFKNVSKHYREGHKALEGVNLRIERGEFVLLTGPSGAGKTTLLRLVYREDRPTRGSIHVAGTDVSSLSASKVPFLRRRIGVVFQSYRLIERRTVLENVSYLPRILGMNRLQRRRSAIRALRRVGLAGRVDAFPSELSGGEQQRVSIARAIINEPQILLADEPTGNLDPQLALEIFGLFRDIHARGATILLATHDPVMLVADGVRRVALDSGRLVDLRAATRSERERVASRGESGWPDALILGATRP